MATVVQGDSDSMSFRTTLLVAAFTILIGEWALRADTGSPSDAQAESIVSGLLTTDEIVALANEVNLTAWTQLAVSRDFTSIEEGWVSVYSPKDAVGVARDWSVQVKMARSLVGRANRANQRRWLELFIEAGEAVRRKDTTHFTAALRALQSDAPAGRPPFAANRNFFTAK